MWVEMSRGRIVKAANFPILGSSGSVPLLSASEFGWIFSQYSCVLHRAISSLFKVTQKRTNITTQFIETIYDSSIKDTFVSTCENFKCAIRM